jgi:hypothetical protein
MPMRIQLKVPAEMVFIRLRSGAMSAYLTRAACDMLPSGYPLPAPGEQIRITVTPHREGDMVGINATRQPV